MKLVLNIGLDVQATSQIAAHVALEIVKINGFLVHKHAVVESDTEPTLVVLVSVSEVSARHQIHTTAVDLKQEAIAAWAPELSKGWLIGPEAAKWGAFDPQYFFMVDGKRLAPAGVAA